MGTDYSHLTTSLLTTTILCQEPSCKWTMDFANPELAEAGYAYHKEVVHGILRREEGCTDREKLLIEAAGLVAGQRDSTYGPPAVNWGRIADALNAVYGPRLDEPGFRFTAADIAVIMIITKLSRQVHVSKYDNWLDIAGYAACGAEVDADVS